MLFVHKWSMPVNAILPTAGVLVFCAVGPVAFSYTDCLPEVRLGKTIALQ